MSTGKKIFFVFFLLLGLAGFCIVPLVVGVDDMLKTVTEVGWVCVAGYIVVASLVIIMPAIGWWIMMRAEGIDVSIMQTIRAAFMGAPMNFFFPSAHLGGDPVKMVYIARVAGVTKRRVLATIVASKMQELAALILLMLGAAIYFIVKSELLSDLYEVLLLVGMGILGAALALLFAGFIFNWRPTVRLLKTLARMGIAPRRMVRLSHWAEDMERIVHATLVHRWRSSLVAQLVVAVSAFSIVFRPFFFYYFLPGAPQISLADCAIIYVIVNFLNTVSFIPGGLGLMEGGIVGYFAASGLGDHNGAALQLLNRITDAVQVTLGLWLIAHHGLTSVAKGVATGEQKIEEKDLRDAAEAEEHPEITRPPGSLVLPQDRPDSQVPSPKSDGPTTSP